jgi:hypothetical protein
MGASERQEVLELISKDDRINVHGVEVEVRPPPAPTTPPPIGAIPLVFQKEKAYCLSWKPRGLVDDEA